MHGLTPFITAGLTIFPVFSRKATGTITANPPENLQPRCRCSSFRNQIMPKKGKCQAARKRLKAEGGNTPPLVPREEGRDLANRPEEKGFLGGSE